MYQRPFIFPLPVHASRKLTIHLERRYNSRPAFAHTNVQQLPVLR